VTTLSRWCNDHERPSEFYQGILCEALSRSRVQLGFEDRDHAEDENGAEPEDLARVLEASNVGPLAIGQLEAKLARRGEELPSMPPAALRHPLLDDYRRVVAWLGGSQPAAERRRLYTVAAQLAGMAGTVFFDLRDPARAEAYYQVALKAAGEAGDDAVAAWVLANIGYLEAHRRAGGPWGVGWSAADGGSGQRPRTVPPSPVGLSRYPTRTPSVVPGHVPDRIRRPAGRSGPLMACQSAIGAGRPSDAGPPRQRWRTSSSAPRSWRTCGPRRLRRQSQACPGCHAGWRVAPPCHSRDQP
jgi:hypothetical protein